MVRHQFHLRIESDLYMFKRLKRHIGQIRREYYLVVTGGTGEAWWYMIKDEFKGLKTLTVLSGNENSELPFTFSNVRGYYFYLYRTVRKMK